jgi:hypothetical protein
MDNGANTVKDFINKYLSLFETDPQLKEFALFKQKIPCIKRVRQLTGFTLPESKNIVDAYWDGYRSRNIINFTEHGNSLVLESLAQRLVMKGDLTDVEKRAIEYFIMRRV